MHLAADRTLICAGLYLSFDYSWSYFYFGVGIFCCLKSMWIFSIRLAARKPAAEQRNAESAA